ncbi:hypothetical protein RIF29_34600 [Crotalaria pallida]|uniref:Uncharacterized protein n=1 Tax=Crotalaria pallida TaxID=3830 RepID=A0AAN9E921_CROPI
MEGKPITTEAVAFTEKKMDMKLDDIVKMSKNIEASKQKRIANKSHKSSNTVMQYKSSKVHRYTETKSSTRQDFLANRRSNFQGNQFPVAIEVAQKAVVAPLRYRFSNRNKVVSWNKARFHSSVSQRRAGSVGFAAKKSLPSPQQQQKEEVNIMPKQRPQTLDSLFANMEEQRMRALSRQNNAVQHNGGGSRRQPWGRDRFGN